MWPLLYGRWENRLFVFTDLRILIVEYLSGLERLAQRESLNLTQSRLVQFDLVKPHERLVSVSFTHYCASTSDLSNSSSWSALQGTEVPGRSRLKDGFPLRCFQRLSTPNIATQLASGETTGTPEVRSLRSSRTRSNSSQISNARSG